MGRLIISSRRRDAQSRLPHQGGEVGHHDVRAVPAQLVGLAHAIDADNVAEVPGPPRVDAGERVLEHHRLRRLDTEHARRGQEGVGRRFAGEMLRGGDDAAVSDRSLSTPP
jgi:hypothetical protein